MWLCLTEELTAIAFDRLLNKSQDVPGASLNQRHPHLSDVVGLKCRLLCQVLEGCCRQGRQGREICADLCSGQQLQISQRKCLIGEDNLSLWDCFCLVCHKCYRIL